MQPTLGAGIHQILWHQLLALLFQILAEPQFLQKLNPYFVCFLPDVHCRWPRYSRQHSTKNSNSQLLRKQPKWVACDSLGLLCAVWILSRTTPTKTEINIVISSSCSRWRRRSDSSSSRNKNCSSCSSSSQDLKINVQQEVFILVAAFENESYKPYLPVYKQIPCISRPAILEPKNKLTYAQGNTVCTCIMEVRL